METDFHCYFSNYDKNKHHQTIWEQNSQLWSIQIFWWIFIDIKMDNFDADVFWFSL